MPFPCPRPCPLCGASGAGLRVRPRSCPACAPSRSRRSCSTHHTCHQIPSGRVAGISSGLRFRRASSFTSLLGRRGRRLLREPRRWTGRAMGARAPFLERASRLWSRSLRAASREPLPPPPPQGRRPYPQWRCSSRWRPSPPTWRRLPSPQGRSVRAPLPSATRSFVVSFVACC